MLIICLVMHTSPYTTHKYTKAIKHVFFFLAELTPFAALSVYPCYVSMETGGGLSQDSYYTVLYCAEPHTNDISQ